MTDTTIDFDSALDDWIAGATVATRSVTIYGKAGLYATYQQVARELELAEAEDGDSVGSSPEVVALKRQLEQVYDDWMASKSEWKVRAVGDLDWELARNGDEGLGWEPMVEPATSKEPAKPVEPKLPKNASDVAKRSHTIKLQEHAAELEKYETALAEYEAAQPAELQAVEEYLDELNLRLLSCVVVEIKLAGGAVGEGISVDQLKTYRSKVGPAQFTKLLEEAKIASKEEPEIPAPFSRVVSEDDQT